MGISFKTKQLLIFYGLGVLIISSVYGFLLFHIHAKSVSAAAFLSQAEQLRGQNNQLTDLNTVLRDIEVDQEKLNSYFVDGDSLVNFIERIEQLGKDSGATVEVRSLNEEATNDKSIQTLVFNLTVKGNWNDVYYFLALVQNLPVKATFDRIQMSHSGIESEDAAPDEWRAVINMKVLELTK